MFPGKVGISRKLIMFSSRYKHPPPQDSTVGMETVNDTSSITTALPTIDSDLLETLMSCPSLCVPLADSSESTGISYSLQQLGSVAEPMTSTGIVSQMSSVTSCTLQSSVGKWAECLPKFSTRIQDVLDRAKVIEDWDCFVGECAYHIIANGDMRSVTDYSEFGQAIVRRYPCAGSTDGTHPWSFFCEKLSQRLRHIRWLRKKRSTGGEIIPKRKPKVAKFLHVPSADDQVSYDDANNELKVLYDSQAQDVPKMLRLLRSTFKERRRAVSEMADTDVKGIITKFPCLQDLRFMAHEFFLLQPSCTKELLLERWNVMLSRLNSLNPVCDSTVTCNGASELALLASLQSSLAMKGATGKKFKPCITTLENKSFKASSTSREPPRLVILVNGSVENGFIFSDGCVIDCNSTSPHDMIVALMFCYYAWQLNYPTQYQLLGFLQEHLIQEDKNTNFFKSAPYIKFNKKFRDF